MKEAIVFFALTLLLFCSCKDETTESVVPLYNVQYKCNTTLINSVLRQTNQIQLDCQGGYVRVYDPKTISAGDVIGVGGLLILHNFEDRFYAFDLACPNCYSEGHTGQKVKRIDIKEDSFTAYCPTCRSEYGAVFWGSPAATAGPANTENLILRSYRVHTLPDGVNIVVEK